MGGMRPINRIEAELGEVRQYSAANEIALDGLHQQRATDPDSDAWTLMRYGMRQGWRDAYQRRRLALQRELTTTRDADDALFYRDHAAHDTRRAAR